MTQEQLKDVLTEHATNPPWIKRKEIAETLGFKNAQRADKYLKGLQRLGTQYFIDDVALAIYHSLEKR